MHNLRTGRTFKKILHLHLCGLDRIRIHQRQIFLKLAACTSLGKVPRSTGRYIAMHHALAERDQVLRKIVGIKGTQARRHIIAGRRQDRLRYYPDSRCYWPRPAPLQHHEMHRYTTCQEYHAQSHTG